MKRGEYDELHIVMCNVGQGDAVLIWQKSYQLLIDGGPDDSVLKCLSGNMPAYDRTIEMMVATHPDADHIGGLIDVLGSYKIDSFNSVAASKNTKVFLILD